MVVSNGIVYVGGCYDGSPCYWQDGVRQEIDCNNGTVAGIATDNDGRLIVAGTCDSEASLWIDGEFSQIHEYSIADINAIYVTD